MTGYEALKSHPFFSGVDWERVRLQEEPMAEIAFSEQIERTPRSSTKSKKRRRSKPARAIKKTPRAKRTKTEETLDTEKEAMKFVEIETTDTYNGYLILKRGSVRVNGSLVGPGDVRQLILCGNQTLMILKTPSQLLKSLDTEQIEDLKDRRHPFYLENGGLIDKLA